MQTISPTTDRGTVSASVASGLERYFLAVKDCMTQQGQKWSPAAGERRQREPVLDLISLT